MNSIVLDIETESLTPKKIHLCVTKNLETNEILCHRDPSTLRSIIEKADLIIGHNIISFDSYHLERLWNISIPKKSIRDTLILSRLENPVRDNGHSLANWGTILKHPKSDFNDFDEYSEEMRQYCINDVELTHKVFDRLYWDTDVLYPKASELEHEVAFVVDKQVRTGVLFDERKAQLLYAKLNDEYKALHVKLQNTVPPTTKELKTKTKVIPFNPSSRKQIGEYLISIGWKPTEYTETGRPIVDERSLGHCRLPVARDFARLFLLEKRLSQIKQWLDIFVLSTGRVHGRVNTNGAVTGRMTHNSPNMAQVPAVRAEYGRECRELFIVPPGYKMVGIDASGLELRMFAHYLKDDDYIKEVVEGDVHTRNKEAAGLTTRDQAKTFIYALLYGAGAEKLGSIAGAGAREGEMLLSRFKRQIPAYQQMVDRILKNIENGTIQGLDGRRLHVRSEHKARNTLIQGAGAIVMKQALVVFQQHLTEGKFDAKIVLNVHDEWQVEVREDQADIVGRLGVQAIEEAGQILGCRCPLTGEYKIGDNWAQTH